MLYSVDFSLGKTHTFAPVLPKGSVWGLPSLLPVIRRGDTLSTLTLRCTLTECVETSAIDLAVAAPVAMVIAVVVACSPQRPAYRVVHRVSSFLFDLGRLASV